MLIFSQFLSAVMQQHNVSLNLWIMTFKMFIISPIFPYKSVFIHIHIHILKVDKLWLAFPSGWAILFWHFSVQSGEGRVEPDCFWTSNCWTILSLVNNNLEMSNFYVLYFLLSVEKFSGNLHGCCQLHSASDQWLSLSAFIYWAFPTAVASN